MKCKADTCRFQDLVGEHNNFGIAYRGVGADKFNPELPELPGPPFLGRLYRKQSAKYSPQEV